MSHLTWTERDHVWRAGPYRIELAAPQLWVCSRRLRDGTARVEFTGGSLTAMKLRGANLNARRLRRRRLALSLAVFVISVAGLALMAQSGAPAAPFFVIALSIVSVVAGIRAIDSVLSRSWESLASTYQ